MYLCNVKIVIMSRVIRMINGECHNCKEKHAKIFKDSFFSFGFPKMNKKCPNCSIRFEKEPGFFVGAMYVSYGLVVLEGIIAYLIGSFFSNNPIVLLISILAAIFLLSVPNYRYSRIIWIHMFGSV